VIIAITGRVEKKEPTLLHILTPGGLVYEIFVSLHCSAAVKENEIKLHTTHIVREDAQLLYGFLDLNEKRMFDTLIKISGVGPKAAMAICSHSLRNLSRTSSRTKIRRCSSAYLA